MNLAVAREVCARRAIACLLVVCVQKAYSKRFAKVGGEL